MLSNNKIKKGFTLIELLITISIIAILSAVSLFGLQGAREGGRDAKRKGDLESIRQALEIYKADCNRYPRDTTGHDFYTDWGASNSPFDSSDDSCSAPANTYLSKIPTDPISGRNYFYKTATAGASYVLCSALEATTSADATCTAWNANCGATCSYSVISP